MLTFPSCCYVADVCQQFLQRRDAFWGGFNDIEFSSDVALHVGIVCVCDFLEFAWEDLSSSVQLGQFARSARAARAFLASSSPEDASVFFASARVDRALVDHTWSTDTGEYTAYHALLSLQEFLETSCFSARELDSLDPSEIDSSDYRVLRGMTASYIECLSFCSVQPPRNVLFAVFSPRAPFFQLCASPKGTRKG